MSTRYVWGRYTAQLINTTRTRYRQVTENINSMQFHFSMTDGQTYQIGSGYSFSESSGSYYTTGNKTYTYDALSGIKRGSGYISSTSGALYYGENWIEHPSYKGLYPGTNTDWSCTKYTSESYQAPYQYYAPGSFLDYVSSASSGAYPSDDESGGSYYKRQGTDTIDPAAITLPDLILEGRTITVTLTPSAGKVYEGAVTYTYQYRTDGGTWQDLGVTGAVSCVVQVPDGAATIEVRARAQDDLGFVSNDWVTSAAAEVTGNRPPSITSSSGPSGADLGTRINPFAVQYTLADPDGDLLTVTEALDGETQREFPASIGTVYSVQVTQNFFGTIPAGAHTLTITASDGDAETSWTASFTKEGGGSTPGPDDPENPEVSKTTSEILIELTEPGAPLPVVHVGWGDQYSRKIQMRLYENGLPYTPPAGTTCAVAWKGSQPAGLGKTGDIYNTIQEANGTTRSACTIEGSTLTVELSDQLCRADQEVQLSVLLIGKDGSVTNIWPIRCRLHPGVCNDDIRMAADHLENIQVNDRGIALSTQ